MPKLNVQQNNANVIKALRNALAIGQIKGPIASDGADNFSSAGGNRNLLDNPWFTNPVNQRGAASLPASAYGIDRWKGGSTGSVSVTSSGLVFGSSGGNAWQPVESALRTWGSGKVFTASVRLSDGTVYSGSGTMGSGTTNFLSTPIELFMSSAGNFNIRASSAYTIVEVKLELGTVSTLANDAPPNYEEELVKCKRYFRRITNIGRGRLFIGVGFSGGVEVPNIFGVGNEMRKTTSLAVTYSGSFVVNAGTDIAVTNITKNENNSNFGLSFTASGITPYTLYSILGSAGAYIDISADL